MKHAGVIRRFAELTPHERALLLRLALLLGRLNGH
jgi:hypothetical protein